MRNQLQMLITGLAVAAGLGNVSCSKVDCGEGTVERDGTCFPADEQPGSANCTPGTVLGPMGCEVEVPTQCDEMTTMEVLDPETGITTCIGTGGGDDCMAEISCASPASGRASLCGRIYDTETDLPIVDPMTAGGAPCDPVNPTATGPCSLELQFYDALDFAQNPMSAMPLPPEGGVYLDDCGRYRGHNMPRATFGFIGVTVDDADGTADRHVLTGVATSNAIASPGNRFRAYVTRNETNTAWTAAAGIGSPSFAERGMLAIIFHYKGMPRSGVTVRRNGNNVPAGEDFYFADTGIARTMIDTVGSPNDVTGPNGTVVVINSPTPISHDGVGGEPAGCIWPANLAASIAGVSFVQIKEAELAGGAACP